MSVVSELGFIFIEYIIKNLNDGDINSSLDSGDSNSSSTRPAVNVLSLLMKERQTDLPPKPSPFNLLIYLNILSSSLYVPR